MVFKAEGRPLVATKSEVRPFKIEFPEADLENLRARIRATRWPDRETVKDDSQGVPLELMQDLADYWATDYDWRRCEAKLDALPNFVTEIDGLDIHFIHVRSKHEDALPLVVCHGWPGSVVEQLKLIGPLTDPTAHGASASDAFHVVIPSMPGYGFSGKPTASGWDPVHIGKAYVELMKRLGYSRFVAQGGDWGAIVVDAMAGGRADPSTAVPAPPELVGLHTNMPGVIPPDLFLAAFTGTPAPSGLSDEEASTYQQLLKFFGSHVAYGLIMGTRPQTLYGLADSPIDLAAFMLDHGDGSGQPGIVQEVLEGHPRKPTDLTRDDILDNITLFWLTNTGVSSARLYWENKLLFFAAKGVTIPVGVSTFADEIYRAPRSWAEQAYPNLVHYNQHDRGGHFAAWEQPQLLSEDIRATFQSLR
jgi:pimeloyl-ACP methyl ester carboxylesterase